MIEKLKKYEQEYQEVLQLLSDPSVLADQKQVAVLGKKESDLKPYFEAYKEYVTIENDIEEFSFLKKEEKDPAEEVCSVRMAS